MEVSFGKLINTKAICFPNLICTKLFNEGVRTCIKELFRRYSQKEEIKEILLSIEYRIKHNVSLVYILVYCYLIYFYLIFIFEVLW